MLTKRNTREDFAISQPPDIEEIFPRVKFIKERDI